MKSAKLSSHVIAALTTAFVMLARPSSAQINAYDDAFHYVYASASWYTFFNTPPGVNYGIGFTTWVVRTNGPASHGFFTTRNGTPLPAISSATNYSNLDTNLGPVGIPPGNNNSAHVWGLFANGTGLNSAVAYRGFSNSLDTTVAFKLQWESIGIGNSANNLGGFALRNGNATNDTSDYVTGLRFAFYYIGGGSNSFVFWDGNGVQHIGIPFASNPLACEFTLKTDDTYRFVVKSLVSGALLAVLDDQPLTGSGTTDSVALFAHQTTGGNQNFNRMQIVSASLTPPLILNVSPTNGSIFVNPGLNNISFEVNSVASTVTGTNMILLLNGVKQTNLAYNTSGPTTQLFATNTAPLTLNTLYNGTIIAVDANGNSATNNFVFNTFSPLNLCIDAEDYNYNAGQFFPNPTPNQYAGLLGSNGIDYLEYDLAGTNNAYRPGDLPQLMAITTGDPYDHAGLQAAGATDYELGWTESGEWQNYTRNLDATNYTVFARAASGGGNGTILLERLADATATSTNQPRAALGTCLIKATGGSRVYSGSLVPLTDFFSNPVLVKFPGNNTFRCTALNEKNYNLNYLMFVSNTNTATLTPYLSAGYPYPKATGVGLDSAISFTIANRQTALNPGSVRLWLNSTELTSRLAFNNNGAGTVVSCIPPNFLPPNASSTLTVVYSDNGGSVTTTTNSWQFTTVNTTITALPATNALPAGSFTTPGFRLRMNKIEDAAPQVATIAQAEAQLLGEITNTATGQPYPNLANGGPDANGSYSETNVLNYDITGQPTGTASFNYKSPFPYVAEGPVNNNIALEALIYVQLAAGNHVFAIRSDDGFKLTTGPAPTNTSVVLGQYDGGRGNGTPSTIYFTAPVDGLYPMRLLYYQAGAGGSVEFYSILNGTSVLINDPNNPNSVKAFQATASAPSPVTILNPAHVGGTTTFSFLTQPGRTHYVEYKDALSDTTWALLTTIAGDGSNTNVTDSTASGTSRFYRVRTQ